MGKILVAMSGGVDSSVAAARLVEEGCAVEGAYMKNWINEDNLLGDCPWQQDIEDARAVADRLGIAFRVVNLMRDYRERIVNYLLQGYQDGITPNPDVFCNREIKFGVFLEYALAEGFESVATGHYARKNAGTWGGTWDLVEGADKNKDQSYFLCLMRQEQLAKARFPVGDLPKPVVRDWAARLGLATAAKKDSQGICFIGNIRMSDFLRAHVPDSPGQIVDLEGKVLGEHQGLHLYTIGQRRGVGVASARPHVAYVVLEKRMATNELVMGYDLPETLGLHTRTWRLGSVSFLNRKLTGVNHIQAKPRYRAPAVPVRLEQGESGDGAVVHFQNAQRAIAAGQICAFYDGETCLGGAVFQECLDESNLAAGRLG